MVGLFPRRNGGSDWCRAVAYKQSNQFGGLSLAFADTRWTPFAKVFPCLVDALKLSVHLAGNRTVDNVCEKGTAMSIQNAVPSRLIRDLNGFCFEMITIHSRQRVRHDNPIVMSKVAASLQGASEHCSSARQTKWRNRRIEPCHRCRNSEESDGRWQNPCIHSRGSRAHS